MDIFAHGLWAAAAAKVSNKKLNLQQVIFWGIFPDFISFAPLFAWMIFGTLFGVVEPGQFRPHEAEPAAENGLAIHSLTSLLYSTTHSLVIFAIVFGIVSLIFRRPILEMLGWLLHILIDIPSHSYKFYPTPFLWPVSGWKFDGISWAAPWFMAINYSVLIIVYVLLFLKFRRRKKHQ